MQTHRQAISSSSIQQAQDKQLSLRARLRKDLRQLDRASRRLRSMEGELHTFLDEYYARVGPLFETLERLRYELESGLIPAPALANTSPEISISESHRQEIKTTFRRLARAHHPDVASKENISDETMRRLNTAYAKSSYGALVQIECETWWQENPADLDMRTLRHRLRLIQKTLKKVRARTRALCRSPAYRLLDKVIDERLAGRDLIAGIAGDAERQIERDTRRIVMRNIREIARLTASARA